MEKARRLWIPLLLGTLLMATLVGMAGAKPDARPEASTAWKTLTVNAADCIPVDDTDSWDNYGVYLKCASGTCIYTCPVPLGSKTVRVKKFQMYAYDEGGSSIDSTLYRTNPKAGNEVAMAEADSTGSTTGVRTFADSSIANNPVRPRHGTYVWLVVPTGDYQVYGFRVSYE